MSATVRYWEPILLFTLAVFFLLVLVLAGTGEAEEDARVYGKVLDNETHEPIEGIRLNFLNVDENGSSNHSVSDKEGNYELGIVGGNMSLVVERSTRHLYLLDYLFVEHDEEKEFDVYLDPKKYRVSLTSNTGNLSIEGENGDLFEFELRVTNTGDDRDKFELMCVNRKELLNEGFYVVVIPTVTMDVDPMKYTLAKATIGLPKNGSHGNHTLEFRAISKNQYGNESSQDTFTLTVRVMEEEVEEEDTGLPGFPVIPVLVSFGIATIERRRRILRNQTKNAD